MFIINFLRWFFGKVSGRTTVYQAQDGWRWHAQTLNNKIVAESGEAYVNPQEACKAAKSWGPRWFDVFISE